MGCRAITPALVGLARKHEGRPFHLVASHNQNRPREQVLAYLRTQRWDAGNPNFTVTSFGGHPQVKGSGYVPYYMVFDHHGRLARHHMGGPYHGGDGLGMVKWVEKLLKGAPAIYVGAEPFPVYEDLAKGIASGRNLSRHVASLEAALQESASSGRKELERLMAAVTRHRDRELAETEKLVARDPARVMPRLRRLKKDLDRSALALPVEEAIARHSENSDLRDAIGVARRVRKLRARYDALPPCPTCKKSGVRGHSEDCASCRKANRKAIATIQKKLLAVIEDHQGLPIVRRIEDWIASLDR